METLVFWINILLPVLSILIPVYTTIYTVNSRIKNENRESHKPYIILESVESLNKLDVCKYFLTLIGRNYRKENEASENLPKKIGGNHEIYIHLILKNIGYGVASNIKFYDLLTGEEIQGTQMSIKGVNQKLFTTYDIAKDEIKRVQARAISYVDESEEVVKEDHNRILCVYKDLNNNIYSVIIIINLKEKKFYDFFAYQPTSRSYKKWIKENFKEYKKIYKQYGSM